MEWECKCLSKEDLQDLGFNDEEIEDASVVINQIYPSEFSNEFIFIGQWGDIKEHITSTEDLRRWIVGLTKFLELFRNMNKDEKDVLWKIGEWFFEKRIEWDIRKQKGWFYTPGFPRPEINETNEALCRFREERKDLVIPDSITPSVLHYFFVITLAENYWDDMCCSEYLWGIEQRIIEDTHFTCPFSDFEEGSEEKSDKS